MKRSLQIALACAALIAACSSEGGEADAADFEDGRDDGADATDTSDSADPNGDPDTAGCLRVTAYTKGDLSALPVLAPAAADEPGLGSCVADPRYGTSVCKIADTREFPPGDLADPQIRPVYSRFRIDNSNGELYLLQREPRGNDGYAVIKQSSDNSVFHVIEEFWSHESAELRWDYSGLHPTTLYYREGCRLMAFDVQTHQSSLVHDFAADVQGCQSIFNDVEGDSSRDSRFWAWMAETASGFSLLTYDKDADRVLGRLPLPAGVTRPNMVDVSPLGSRMVALFSRTDLGDAYDGPHAFTLDFSGAPVKVCNDETHSGFGFGTDGEELFVCQVNNWNWPNADADTLAATDIATGQTMVVAYHEDFGFENGFHFSRFYDPAIRGFVYLTTYADTGGTLGWAANAAIMLELKPAALHPRIWRIASTHNDYPGPDGYPREAYSPISGDGQRVFWAADWPGGDGTVDTYQVTLPERWWERLADYPACP